MIRSKKIALKLGLLTLILGLYSACSWEYHRKHFKTEFYNPQPGEFYSRVDSMVVDSTFCERKQFFIKEGNWLHMVTYRCQNLWQVDTAFAENGNHYYVRKAKLSNSKSYLYDSAYYIEFDQKMRAIRRTTSIFKPDTNYDYWQYYREDGGLEEKRPVIIELLAE